MYIIAYIVYIVVGSITFAVLETSGYEEQIDEAAEAVAQDRVTKKFVDLKKAILSKCPTIGEKLSFLSLRISSTLATWPVLLQILPP